MCCEECPEYEKCSDNDSLKDNCCFTCPLYRNCASMDTGGEKEDSYGGLYNEDIDDKNF